MTIQEIIEKRELLSKEIDRLVKKLNKVDDFLRAKEVDLDAEQAAVEAELSE